MKPPCGVHLSRQQDLAWLSSVMMVLWPGAGTPTGKLRPRHAGAFSALGQPATSSPLVSLAVKIKKPIKTKFRMPVFNWVALKPNQINGTVFNEIDDERILEVRVLLAACSLPLRAAEQESISLCRDRRQRYSSKQLVRWHPVKQCQRLG